MTVYRILFLCTHNSARSVLGEAAATTASQGRFVGYSAGSQPSGLVNPIAAEVAAEMGYDAAKLRSKSWDEFAAAGAPQMDFIITVCDSAAAETCPVWPGMPSTAHWGFADPSRVTGSHAEKKQAFLAVAAELTRRIRQLAALPLEQMDRAAISQVMRDLSS
jgi:arsenate reductase